MGAKSKLKGKRAEREVVALARLYGLDARRTSQTAHSYIPAERVRDVQIEGEFFQCQVRANGFGTIYDELEGVRGFFFRRDRSEWLIALRASEFLSLLGVLKSNSARIQFN